MAWRPIGRLVVDQQATGRVDLVRLAGDRDPPPAREQQRAVEAPLGDDVRAGAPFGQQMAQRASVRPVLLVRALVVRLGRLEERLADAAREGRDAEGGDRRWRQGVRVFQKPTSSSPSSARSLSRSPTIGSTSTVLSPRAARARASSSTLRCRAWSAIPRSRLAVSWQRPNVAAHSMHASKVTSSKSTMQWNPCCGTSGLSRPRTRRRSRCSLELMFYCTMSRAAWGFLMTPTTGFGRARGFGFDAAQWSARGTVSLVGAQVLTPSPFASLCVKRREGISMAGACSLTL